MKTITVCALVLLLSAGASYAKDDQHISISFSSDDSHTRMGPRHAVRDARFAITTRDGSTSLLLTNDVVAVQLSDRSLAGAKTKDDANFLEKLIISGVQLAIRKSVEYPIANIRSAEIREGVLVLTNDQNKPVFDAVKVNGSDVLRGFSGADAARFVTAFRAAKAAQR